MSAGFLLRRLLLAVPTLFGVVVVVFVLLRVTPGDPISMMIGPGATLDDIARLRALYGLDRPIPEQFLIYVGQILQGDLGTSITGRQDVVSMILRHLPATLELAAFAMFMAMSAGVALGVLATLGRGRWPEAVVDAFIGFVVAIPDFLWGLLFILVLGVLLPVMPVSGRIDLSMRLDYATRFYMTESLLRLDFAVYGSIVRHALLPAAALALPLMAIGARVLKSSLKEAMRQEYVLLARTRGYGHLRIVVTEALRNALVPTVTLTGVQFTFLIGGTVLIERIFSYPGIGNMAVDAVINRDLPLIQGIVLTFAVLFIVTNLLVDISYALLDPRLRHG